MRPTLALRDTVQRAKLTHSIQEILKSEESGEAEQAHLSSKMRLGRHGTAETLLDPQEDFAEDPGSQTGRWASP